ncbi:MAG: YihY/virulence factor BrkB family protein [Pararhodobacter sp.]|nr:YihY/virulence factor BrkB family protein [Pararhodobacter sp.]
MTSALTYARAVWSLMGERNLGLIAAGVAFFAMLAIFPAVAALISLLGFWIDPIVVENALDLLVDFLPEEAFAIISDQIQRLASAATQTLGLTSALSLLVATWSARLGVGALIQGITAIYGNSQRSGVRGTALALFLTVILIGVGVIAVTSMLFMPVAMAVVERFLPGDSYLPLVAELLRWAIALGALVIGLGLFYRYGPNRPKDQRSPFLSPGLFLSLVLWSGASLGFSIYLANFGNYNEIYGSIGAVIALLMWLYISAYAALIGAALNYVIENRDRNDQSADGSEARQ